jgi:serine/threonine-protein kinase
MGAPSKTKVKLPPKNAPALGPKQLIGKVIGGYKIISKIAKGTTGVVFKAEAEEDGQVVAIKILKGKWARDKKNLKRFEREAQAAKTIRHPNVVSVFGFGQSEGLQYLAMTFVDGPSLQEILTRYKRVNAAVAVRMGIDIGAALEATEKVGLVHRDVKPGNLMVDKSKNCVLTDLGLAKAADHSQDLTTCGFTMGTPFYMAPEQVMNQGELSISCDVYSLGATLFHALVGRVPFEGEKAFDIMKGHVKTPAPDPRDFIPDCPDELAEIVLRMMAKAPEDRPTPTEVASTLRGLRSKVKGKRTFTILESEKRRKEATAEGEDEPQASSAPAKTSAKKPAKKKESSGSSRSSSRSSKAPAAESGAEQTTERKRRRPRMAPRDPVYLGKTSGMTAKERHLEREQAQARRRRLLTGFVAVAVAVTAILIAVALRS